MCNTISAQEASFSVKNIICPNICKKETTYRIVFEAFNGSITTTKGTVQNDTIVGILPENDYQVTLTFTSADAKVSTRTIDLPVCDPIFPSPPLVGSQTGCSNTPIPPFVALATQNTTVDWYAQPSGGSPLQTDALTFTPNKAGKYYAQARFTATGCASLSRTSVSLEIKKTMCPPIGIRKIRN